ncbi:MAG: hypothetical protein EZS28_000064 [Streblomastix strix]|uniref:Tyr recombinase domain-containing protein n=1 Tax=Streblomastix strix TaxID=222440 RepID=A0A5J4XD05_9EUKA|nr:MAG: hypothetical protein EZS28_000064 [Streblomastix strix]
MEEKQFDAGKMEKDCNQIIDSQSQIFSKFHWVFELHEALFNRGVLKEIFRWMAVITNNHPIQATIIQPQAILATDANQTHWSATLKLFNPKQEVWFWGKWSQNWHLTSRNQREAAAIHCSLRQSEIFLNESRSGSSKVGGKNSGNCQKLQPALHQFHIPEETNKIPDSLSRLTTSGDYSLHQEVFEESMRSLKIRPSIEIGQIGSGTRLYVTPMKGRTTIPPSTDSTDPSNSQQKDGRSNEESKKASSSRRNTRSQTRGNRGEELFKWILSKRQLSESATQQVIDVWHSIWSRYRQRIGQFEEFWTKSGKSWEVLTTMKDPETVISNFIAQQVSANATNANSYACRTAVGMLFRIQGFQEDKINGFALKQIMKKPTAAARKKTREEPKYKLNVLLKYIQGKAQDKQKLNEQENLGCTISSIMAFSIFRLAEIHRASVVHLDSNVSMLNTSIQKGNHYDLTVTFGPLSNSKVCPTEWLQSWFALRKKDELDKLLWWRAKNMKTSSYEYLSKSVHLVMSAAGVHKGNSVTSIRKSSITKSLNQGAKILEINRASRHKDGPSTVAAHYDMNLNETIKETHEL